MGIDPVQFWFHMISLLYVLIILNDFTDFSFIAMKDVCVDMYQLYLCCAPASDSHIPIFTRLNILVQLCLYKDKCYVCVEVPTSTCSLNRTHVLFASKLFLCIVVDSPIYILYC